MGVTRYEATIVETRLRVLFVIKHVMVFIKPSLRSLFGFYYKPGCRIPRRGVDDRKDAFKDPWVGLGAVVEKQIILINALNNPFTKYTQVAKEADSSVTNIVG